MKRTFFKKKLTKPLKKSYLKKKSKVKISVVQRKLWNLCKQIVRLKYGNQCYTCGASPLVGANWQTGHMWSKASLGAYLKYDIRLLRPQCTICNIWRGGMGADFYQRMLKEIGEEALQKLQEDRKVSVQAMDHYLKLVSDYQGQLELITKNK